MPDDDAPDDAASMKFWCSTSTKYVDREKTRVRMQATANVAATSDELGTLLGDVGAGGMGLPSSAMAVPGAAGVNLGELVDVIRAGGGEPAAKGKAKAKPKAKGATSKKSKLEEAKTPAEQREAVRNLVHTSWQVSGTTFFRVFLSEIKHL